VIWNRSVRASSNARWPLSGQAARPERIHIAVGTDCNNNCSFCMEHDREGRRRVNGALTPALVHRILATNRASPEVCFTSGEPTLVAALPDYIMQARAFGFQRVSLSSNGRRLCYRPYCAGVIGAGLDRLYLSIHGHTAKIHDRLVRTQGAFEQSVQGMANAVREGESRLALHTCTVVTKLNLEHLGDIYFWLREHGAQQVVFNAMQPQGRANTYFEHLFPRYSEIVERFCAVLRQGMEQRPPAFLVDIPPCVTVDVPTFNRGWVEPYVHHEVGQASGEAPSSCKSTLRADLVPRRRLQYARAHSSKSSRCAECIYDGSCVGVWDNYLMRFGWEEFQPVKVDPMGTHDACFGSS
jgi:MoaA/NifB/PqqE/SkfB family radical SAM enzyme